MLLKFSHQIAHGMDYLSRKGFVHRDLAARNILLTKDFTCKISDFGMSRDLTGSNYYMTRGGRVPVKWTAPEAILYCKYSTNSDIWSYGMVLYEIWSIGWKPFDSFSIDQVINIINTGYCQPPPPGVPKAIYSIMVQCWNPEPRKRPSFPLLYATLGKSSEKLLQWSSADREGEGEGAVLGAALIESLDMFPDLQFVYRSSEN
jgi:serine/threonine protein kinase